MEEQDAIALVAALIGIERQLKRIADQVELGLTVSASVI